MTDAREYPTHPICGVGVVVRKVARAPLGVAGSATRDHLPRERGGVRGSNDLLLIRRGHAPRLGEWGLPGGAVELGESLREAARREVREECGIEIEVDQVIDAVDVMQRDDSGRLQFHYIVIDFVAAYVSGDLRAASDVTDARWVTPSDLEGYSLNPKTREVIAKAFAIEGKPI